MQESFKSSVENDFPRFSCGLRSKAANIPSSTNCFSNVQWFETSHPWPRPYQQPSMKARVGLHRKGARPVHTGNALHWSWLFLTGLKLPAFLRRQRHTLARLHGKPSIVVVCHKYNILIRKKCYMMIVSRSWSPKGCQQWLSLDRRPCPAREAPKARPANRAG